ncbi:MAG: DUF3761 domain-containing protein [Burkholderiales bacterium]
MKASGWLVCAAIAIAAWTCPQSHAPRLPPHVDGHTTRNHQPLEQQLVSHHFYSNGDGIEVHSPSKTVTVGITPNGASAVCRDGTYRFSTHRNGTCSHHGGVDRWL